MAQKGQTVTVLIGKLVKLGYVNKEQDSQDARVQRLSVTEKGRELRPVFEELSKSLITAIYKNFTADEKDQIITLLDKIKL